MKPQYFDKSEIPQNLIDLELKKISDEKGKGFEKMNAEAKTRLIEGKMKKFYQDNCLTSMNFLLDNGDEENSKTVIFY